ncbi:MAG TPA: flagellar protein FlaG [Candidatus Methylomirabilis sp.]|nr:flagellar protein FlaG [Candidatus Methylomirabilis sp.]
MKAEIEPVGGIASAESGLGATLRSPDHRPPVRPSAPPPAAPEPQGVGSPQVVGSPEDVGLVFEVSRDGRDLVIKVVDRNTREIIREIPPEEVQRLNRALDALVGRLLDRRG